jgi:nucleoside-diphosphate-sugar epimerase
VSDASSRAVVTGARGFIGRALVPYLRDRGWRVTAVDLAPPPGGPAEGIEAVTGDIRALDGWRHALDGADVVIHLASAHLRVDLPESFYWETNVASLPPLLEASRAAGVRHFVHTSSVGVHGSLVSVPGNEDSPLAPENLYERTKAGGEAKLREFLPRAAPMGVTVVRPAWVYGPGDPRTERILSAVSRGRFIMFGRGHNLRHPIFIDDYLDGVARLLLRPETYGRTYILGGPAYMPVEELLAAAERVTGGKVRIRVPLALGFAAGLGVELAAGLARITPPISRRTLAFFTNQNAFDTARARTDFGFDPTVGIGDGLGRVWAALRARHRNPR